MLEQRGSQSTDEYVPMANAATVPQGEDERLYVPEAVGWQRHLKSGWEKQYCFYKRPGEEFCHLLMSGEIFLQRGEEQVCLMCALRRGIVTTDRLYWQRAERRTKKQNPRV